MKKPDGRFGSAVEAGRVRRRETAGDACELCSDACRYRGGRCAQRQGDHGTTPRGDADCFQWRQAQGRRRARDPLAQGRCGRRKADGARASPRPDYLAQALTAASTKDAKADVRAAAYVAALRSAETLADGQLFAAALSPAIKAVPRDDATLPYAEPLARAALLAGDAKLAGEWRKHLGTATKDKQDAWALARLDLMLSYAGATTEKPNAILERLLAAAPYPTPVVAGAAPAPKAPATADQQLTIRRIENTRALFLYSGTGRDLTAEQRATLASQRTAGRGVSDSAIARIYAAARQDADAEAALAIVGQLGADVSALSFAGLSDLLVQMQAIGLTDDANAIALEALQVWKAL